MTWEVRISGDTTDQGGENAVLDQIRGLLGQLGDHGLRAAAFTGDYASGNLFPEERLSGGQETWSTTQGREQLQHQSSAASEGLPAGQTDEDEEQSQAPQQG